MSLKKCKESSAHYRLAQRHIDYYIKQVVDSPDILFSLDDLREWLAGETGFYFQKRTLKKYLKECIDKCGEAPLEEIFRLNPDYYKNQKVKPPNPYGPRDR